MGCSQSNNCYDTSIPADAPKLKSKLSSSYSSLQIEKTEKGTYVCNSRSKMKLQVGSDQDFLNHHLENQLCLSGYASAYKIRARQIIEHYMFNDFSHNKIAGEYSTSKLTQFALKAWFQRIFLDCLEVAEESYFQKGESDKNYRSRFAEEYIFEIYKMGQFINSGFGKFSVTNKRIQIPLSVILLNSDSSIFPLLTRIQENYPLVNQNPSGDMPNVKTYNKNIDLLKLIPSQSHSDPAHINIQTTFNDLRFLIEEANSLYESFSRDMIALFGSDAKSDCKVKKTNDGCYQAAAVRRVFIKWSETMIERVPDVYLLQEFQNFLASKKVMANNFVFKGIVSETTHEQVIHYLSLLLEAIKYKSGTKQPREEFGLFLYDLLRCKVIRMTGDEVAKLLQNLESLTLSPNGQLLEVVRVKDRLKTANRDILVNFRYGKYLVAQVQLCIDSSHDSPQITKKIKFRHYLYELERGLFGPTFQLMMQYEDYSRKDITVTLQAQGELKQRKIENNIRGMKKAGRICPQKHQMIAVKGNIFDNQKLQGYNQQQSQQFFCDFCFQKSSYSKQYHYCYYCTLFYCIKCLNIYKSTNLNNIQLSCRRKDLLMPIQTIQELSQHCQEYKSIVLIIYQEGKQASKLFLDQVTYLLSTYTSQNKSIPSVFTFNIGNNSFQHMIKRYNVTRLPTTLILDQKQDPLVTLVGATFHDIEALFEVSERIKNGLPKGLKIKCNICHSNMNPQLKIRLPSNEKCQSCMDTNKIQDFGDLVRSIRFNCLDFYCPNGHKKCSYCSYLSSNEPSYFRDHTGRTYLSNRIFYLPYFCSNHHLLKITSSPKSFNCKKCKQDIKLRYDQQYGRCSICQEYICPNCLEGSSDNYKDIELKQIFHSVEIVSHFSEDIAEQSWPCGCGKPFLKVYNTRKLMGNHENKIQKVIKGLLFQQWNDKWSCYVCKKQNQKLRLHLACFYCQYAKSIKGTAGHIEICINCAVKSQLIGRQRPERQINQTIQQLCPQNHKTVKTSIPDPNTTYYQCVKCKNIFYDSTVKIKCSECSFKCCLDCSIEQMVDPNPPKTTKLCDRNHELILNKRKPEFQFCESCKIYLKDGHFKCGKNCRYHICLSCASK